MWYTNTPRYITQPSESKIMPFVATGMGQEIIIPSEASQTDKDKYYMISLICEI